LRALSPAASRNGLYHRVATGEKRSLAGSHHGDPRDGQAARVRDSPQAPPAQEVRQSAPCYCAT
jgi:hypothetical protein